MPGRSSVVAATLLVAVAVLVGCGAGTADGDAHRQSPARAPAGSPTAAPAGSPTAAPPRATLDCGTASNGLGVEAHTARDEATVCPLAVEVADSYLARPEAAAAEGRSGPVEVTVRGTAWSCRQVATEINPFVECASGADPAEKVQLVS